MQIKNDYLKKVRAWLLPFTCILCSSPSQRNQDLCEACYQELPNWIHGCSCCGISLSQQMSGMLCGQCLQKPRSFDVTHALFAYELPIIKLILELKFNYALVNARLFGELLAQSVLQTWYQNKALPTVIIPVPLHPLRLKERGFNQALEIARPVAKRLKLPIETAHCHRLKSTAPQAKLPAAHRRSNVKGAFRVTKQFTDQHIAVIDDVITTGSTITEFCHVLKQSGAQRIDVWCVARVD